MRGSRVLKRLIDIALASFIFLVSLPLLVVVALLILILEGRPVFYISRRMVSRTRAIPLIKFRTMVRDAKSPKYRLVERFMRDGYLDIPRTCDVYTPIGRFLERTQIVEIPQVLNVLFHGMSFIGNRPLPEENVRMLQRIEGWEKRFESPAGITGISQVVGKLSLKPFERLELESAYSDLYNRGDILFCDLAILYYTLRVIVTSRGLGKAEAFRLAGVTDRPRVVQRGAAASGAPLKILVLGATSVIGSEIAAAFAEGNRMVLSGRNPAALREVALRCRENGAEDVEEAPLDLGVPDAVSRYRAVDDIDLVINAASSTSRLRDDEIGIEDFGTCLTADVAAPVQLLRSVIKKRGRRELSVIYVSSVLAALRTPGRGVYGSLKLLHERTLLSLARSRPEVRVLIVRVAKFIAPDRHTPAAAELAAAVRRHYDNKTGIVYYGAAGRLLLALYYIQPVLLAVAIRGARALRGRRRPVAGEVSWNAAEVAAARRARAARAGGSEPVLVQDKEG